MRTLLAATSLFVAALAATGTVTAQQPAATPAAPALAGNAEAGKVHYTFGNTSCTNCHGTNGEGSFGPALAGRPELTYERFRRYVRNPLGRMPAYVETELTDQEIADMVVYFQTLPKGAKPAAWRTPLPENAPRGQQLAVSTIGCGQCHGATFSTPRHGMAEVNGDFEWFKRMVYNHTTTQREQMAMLDAALPRVTPGFGGPPGRNRLRMGNYSPQRLPEATLKEIYDWAVDLGRLPVLAARMAPAAAPATNGGTTYTIDVYNSAVKNKGVDTDDVTVALDVPSGVQVVSATGTGYEGVRSKADGSSVATWRLPRLAAADHQALTITLSSAAPALRGTIRWARPAVKADDDVTFALPGARRGRGAA
jgi:mono/diheme cytochrome c family protein